MWWHWISGVIGLSVQIGVTQSVRLTDDAVAELVRRRHVQSWCIMTRRGRPSRHEAGGRLPGQLAGSLIVSQVGVVVVIVLVITLRAIVTNTGHTGHTINNIGVHNHWTVGANHISAQQTTPLEIAFGSERTTDSPTRAQH